MAQDHIDNGDAMLRDLGIDIRDLAGEFEHCQRAPTAMNQQAFTLTLTSFARSSALPVSAMARTSIWAVMPIRNRRRHQPLRLGGLTQHYQASAAMRVMSSRTRLGWQQSGKFASSCTPSASPGVSGSNVSNSGQRQSCAGPRSATNSKVL